nr:amino acid ABC transporter substrate-binding protein [Ramlibacter paludis]
MSGRLACALLLCLLAAGSAFAGERLQAIQARGVLRCGVSEGIAGFSARDAAGRWSGLDADFCRAVAAAALGSADKVQFLPLSAASRFPALQSGAIDLLVRQATWTLGREIGLGARFAGILLYDGQGFMVPAAGGAKTLAALAGATICVEKGTTHADNLADHFATRGWKVQPLVLDSPAALAAAFFAGRCQACSSDASQLAALRVAAPGGAAGYVILDERISKEPLGPVVATGDEAWVTLVRWVLFVLVAAEEQGVTQANAATRWGEPALKRSLGGADEFSKALGVAPGWALRALQAVGNYGELFERNVGAAGPLKLERGLNRPWNQGGLLYAPPLR